MLAGIGLRDQQVVDIDPQLAGINRVERMLGVDKGADATGLLRFSDTMQRKGGFTRGFRAVNLDYTPAGEASDTKRNIQRQ